MRERHSLEASTEFSAQHFFSAEMFADSASELENQAQGLGPALEIYARHQAYVSGAIFASVAFLEAYINELFHGCYESPARTSSYGLGYEQVRSLAFADRKNKPRFQPEVR